MSEGAEVRSLAQLVALRQRTTYCRAQTIKEAEQLQAELNKLTRWIEDEAGTYWQQQLVLAERWTRECREALSRCEAAVRADEKRPCTDERKRLEKALARKSLCDGRVRIVREAQLVWQRQVVKLRGRLQHLADLAESDMQVTLQKMDQIIQALSQYAQLRSPPPPPD